MRIAIEALSLSSKNLTGIGNVTLNYIRELQRLDPDNSYFIYTIDALLHADLPNEKWRHVRYDWRVKKFKYRITDALGVLKGGSEKTLPALSRIVLYRILKMALEAIDRACLYFWLAKSMRDNRIDVYLGFFADFFPLCFFSGVRKIWLIHDLVWKLYPETTDINSRNKKRAIVRNMNRADLLLSVSDSTRNDLVRLLKIRKDIITLHNAADRKIFHPADPKSVTRVKKSYEITRPYILSVCTLEPRKNLATLLDAYAKVHKRVRHQLVLAGMSGWKNTKLFEMIERHPAKHSIIVTGYVPSQDLAPLYSGADVFVFPTLYEGFGMPVLEAMQCGCPVISSTSSSIPEVAGDACVLVDPLDTEALAASMEKILSDRARRSAMTRKGLARSKQFSWEKSAARLLEIIRTI
ncbi:MAG TPA: glycosyltransferase family 1 protein [Spirochaetota bacterium]|nr:glycosyltransferase family 1 protein [Spirochaetota bacterium]HQH97747.1 glycosyltransferase family 1 protein [Spirochaetota bacterium]